MVILVPWKPVALVLGLLSALILISYFGSAILHGEDPFAPASGNWRSMAIHRVSNHPTVYNSHVKADKHQ